MRRTLRQSVRTRYEFGCGYCGISETNIGAERGMRSAWRK